jgi:lipopolysaccharide transport system permease protein
VALTSTRAAPPSRWDAIFPEPLATLVRHRHLIRVMVARDLNARYRGSLIGFAWALLVPILLVAVYTTFFAGILRVRLSESDSAFDFALFLMAANIPWSAINETLLRSTTIMNDYRDVAKRSIFALEVLPVMLSATSLIEQGVAYAIFLCAVVLFRGTISPWVILLPAVAAIQWLLTVGLAWAIASISVYARDTRHLLLPVLTMWLFLTPIFYPVSSVPTGLRWLIAVNPLAPIVESYRLIALQGKPPLFDDLLVVLAIAWLVALGGLLLFRRLRVGFADQL